MSNGPDPVLVSERVLARPQLSDGQTQTKTRPLVNLRGGTDCAAATLSLINRLVAHCQSPTA